MTHMWNRVKTRLAPQPTEYGSACLAMLAEYYGAHINLFEAARVCGADQDGCTMEQLSDGADRLGFRAEMRKADAEMLREARRPCIVTVDGKFAVLSVITRKKAVLYTPDRGRAAMTFSAFEASCGENALFLTPEKTAAERKKTQSPLAYAFSLILKQNFGQTALYALILVGVSMLLMGATQIAGLVTDRVFSGDYRLWQDVSLWRTVSLAKADARDLLGMTAAIVVLGALLLLEIWAVPVFGRFSAKVSGRCRKDFTWSALNLPVDLYGIRSDGYFMSSSVQSHSLGYFLSKQMVEVIIRPLLSVCFLIIMAGVSVPCCIVVLASVVVMVSSSLLFAGYENATGRIVFSDRSRESGFLLEGLKAIRSIRHSGSEFVFFRDYVGLNRKSAKTMEKTRRVQRIFAGLPASVSNITRLALILAGAYYVYTGSISFGQLIFVHGIYCIVADYIRTAVHSGQSILSVKYELENLEEIRAEAEDEETSEIGFRAQTEFEKLKGHIRIDHVTFGYSRRAGPILDDISMDVPTGSSVAIVGATGCGKTTLKKLICGRHEPWSGEILFDGIPGREIPREVLVNSISSVDQHITLFEDTVMNNIKMWDASQIDADAILAARDAEIHDEILIREQGYQSMLSEDGDNFSGGQRQRLEIARALSLDPSILVLDEATSALDTIVEKRIVENVRARGITTIVIAHRLSTIRECDCIYVMDQGHFVGRGTHDELMRTCGLYRTLVTVE